MLEGRIDSSVVYEGPRARTATLTGSPVWGLGDRSRPSPSATAIACSAPIAR